VNYKNLFLLISLSALALALTACGIGGGKTYKIGLLSPQTGPIAVYAPGFQDAANVAIAELNDNEDGNVFELVIQDSGCDGTQAATATQTLVDSGVVGIVGAACSGATLGAIAVASEAGIPMVSYASTSPAVTTASDNGYLFRVVPSDAQQAIALTAVVSDAGDSNPAILYMTNDYGSGLADNFQANWSGSACTTNAYDPTEGSYDASTIAQSVIDAGCDSAVLVSYATDGASIVEALKSQGFEGTIYGADGIADAAFVEAFTDASAVTGIVATKPRPGKDSTAKSTFDTAYKAAGGNTEGIYTGETYDAVKIVAHAALEGGDNIRADIKTIGSGYDGASGVHTFDSNGDVAGTGYEVCNFDPAFSCSRVWTAESGLSN
jgi:branched-chain amino acid transport system substrate-binding protein